MSESLFIQPPEIKELEDALAVIFLAGPIQGASEWQYDAKDIIQSIDASIVVASPRKHYAPDEFIYEKQVDWESHYLQRAARCGTILFWLPAQVEATPGRAYGQTSRVELGEWKTNHVHDPSINLVVGMPGGFGNERYLTRRIQQDCPEVPITTSLEDTCIAAIRLAVRHK